jgi:hypothetical protein
MAEFKGEEEDVQDLPVLQLQIHMNSEGQLEVSVQAVSAIDHDEITDLLDAAIATLKDEL